MNRALPATLLALCLLLSGCGFVGGDGATPTQTPVPDGVESLSFTEGSTLNVTKLYPEHTQALSTEAGYELRTNYSFDPAVGPGYAAREIVRRADLTNERALFVSSLRFDNGTSQRSQGLYLNDSTMVSVTGPTGDDSPQYVPLNRSFRQTAVSASIGDTPMNLAAPLELEYAETEQVDGQRLHRFEATRFAPNVSEQAIARTYGTNATVDSASMLLTPDGLIREFQVGFAIDDAQAGTRHQVDASWRLVTVGSVTVERPSWVNGSG